MSQNKEINYIGRDFNTLKSNLIELARTYFPQINSDFSDSRPETLLVEMSAYVGDILSFYTDRALKESLLSTCNETDSLYAHAASLGVNPRQETAATTELEIYQLVPNINIGGVNQPDYNYALTINNKAQFTTSDNSSIIFRLLYPVDFKLADGREESPYSYDAFNNPEWWLLKKTGIVKSGQIKTITQTFTAPKPYDKITIFDENVSEVLDIVDSEGNLWYEVSSLAQDTVLLTVPNDKRFSPSLSKYKEETPFLIKVKKTPYRYTIKILSDSKLVIQFGAGTTELNDEEIIPNQKNIRNTKADFERTLDFSIDPNNFLKTSTYGKAPTNTTLTIRYVKNLGLVENVPIGAIDTILDLPLTIEEVGLNQSLLNKVRSSVTVTNPSPATGANNKKSPVEIREDIKAALSAQKRIVTTSDYIFRTLSMPERYGSIAKVYKATDTELGNKDNLHPNPLAVNLFILSYDKDKKFTAANKATKTNLQNYLEHYRTATDAINIMDAGIINFGISFNVTVDPLSYLSEGEVLVKAIENLKNLYAPENMEIKKPLFISDIRRVLEGTEGVVSVNDIKLENKYSKAKGYSGYKYDFDKARSGDIIYPAKYPSVFEIRFPDNDITGIVTNLSI